ncbi:MAG: hypothetical protein HUU06_14275, partial [Planctomycetaceae bacterium]|nr:hypothetical protein [Planctomycetaceae bacterium]
PSPPPGGESPSLARLRRWGLLLLVLASFLPYHGCRAHPSRFEKPSSEEARYYKPENGGALPATYLEWVLREKVLDLPALEGEDLFPSEGRPSDDQAGLAVYLAVPVWILLLAAAALGPRWRIAAGVAAHLGMVASLVAVGVLVLDHGFDQLGPDWLKGPEAAALLLGSVGLCVLRPRHRWRIDDVEAAVSGHAVLALGAASFWPQWRYLEWTLVDGHSPGVVLLCLWENYRIGFWVGLLGLGLTAAPLYLSGLRGAPVHERLLPLRRGGGRR